MEFVGRTRPGHQIGWRSRRCLLACSTCCRRRRRASRPASSIRKRKAGLQVERANFRMAFPMPVQASLISCTHLNDQGNLLPSRGVWPTAVPPIYSIQAQRSGLLRRGGAGILWAQETPNAPTLHRFRVAGGEGRNQLARLNRSVQLDGPRRVEGAGEEWCTFS